MKEAILVTTMLFVFVYGYSLMGKMDKFINENRKAIQKESEKQELSCVMLTDELSDEEIVKEVRRFRNKHKGTRIMLYDSANTDFSDSIEYQTDLKQ